MAYTINRFSGVPFITVEDGTIDTTTDLKLVGKNYTGYGEIQNENFIHLLENFTGTAEPGNGITGQIWYDSGSEKIKVYDGAGWKATGGAEVSSTAPAGLAEGDLWWDSSTNQLKILNSNDEYILVGPQRAGAGTTQMKSVELSENGTGTLKGVIAAYVGDQIVYFVSKDEFTPNTSQDIDGWISSDYPIIKSGLTLRSTNSDGLSVTDATGETNVYWGTAGTAYKLTDGTTTYGPNDFVRVNALSFSTRAAFADAGFTVGDSTEIIFDVTDGSGGTDPKIKFNTDNTYGLGFKIEGAAGDLYKLGLTGFMPGATNAYDIGASGNVWRNIYANTFTGTATRADALKETSSGSYRAGNTSADPDTVAVRDGSGNLTATVFNGTATKARYADLAEKYTTGDEELPAGTAVSVCPDDCCDVHPAKSSDICIGVVSTNPAVMMNSDCDGQYIGLKGRLPVRVKGPVKKGQAVYAWEDGICSTVATSALVGVALETNDSDEEKLVECVLKT
jgi:hypothetical protein